jgi:ribosomal protein L37AE/L43A
METYVCPKCGQRVEVVKNEGITVWCIGALNRQNGDETARGKWHVRTRMQPTGRGESK